ncbi:hypothetical protein [Hymenobacter sp. 102]|uniref:hypothetical protein n=1 Tax=Hymenobacter sp. 102 TaxID=3403152 RepID=UPI003CF03BBB
MPPAFPLLCLQQEAKPYCYLVEEPQDLGYCSLTGYYDSQQKPELYFDASGRKYRTRLKLKRSFSRWQKLLSYFYWGRIPVENEWYLIGNYCFEELKDQVERCIKADDDVMTQFIEPEHLTLLVHQARHFGDLYMVLNGAIYNFEDDESIEG